MVCLCDFVLSCREAVLCVLNSVDVAGSVEQTQMVEAWFEPGELDHRIYLPLVLRNR